MGKPGKKQGRRSKARASRTVAASRETKRKPATKRKQVSKTEQASLFVRIDKNLKMSIEALADDLNVTTTALLTSVLEFSKSISREDLRSLVHGAESPSSVFMAVANWAEHAMERERWSWALSWYRRMERHAEVTSPSVYQWLQYRQGYAWLYLGEEIRRDSWRPTILGRGDAATGSKGLDESFRGVEDCLKMAQHHFRRYQEAKGAAFPSYPTVLYNQACCFGLAAAIEVERILLEDGAEAFTSRMREKIKADDDTKKIDEGLELFWDQNGRKWRETLMSSNKAMAKQVIRRVEALADRSIERLRGMPASPDLLGPNETFVSAHLGPLLRWASTDPHMVLLRHDPHYSQLLSGWQSQDDSAQAALHSLLEQSQETLAQARRDWVSESVPS